MEKERIPELCFTRKDFRVDTFRATGKGGQHRNKTDSAVRITHIATGISAECSEERSQLLNKKKAFRKLARILIAKLHPEVEKKRFEAGKERVRTYNLAENYIRNEKSGQKFPAKQTFEKNKMVDVIQDCQTSTQSQNPPHKTE